MNKELFEKSYNKIIYENNNFIIKSLFIMLSIIIAIVLIFCKVDKMNCRIILSGCCGIIGFLFWWILYLEIKLPYAKSDFFSAILVIIDSENKDEYNGIKSKLIDLFKKSLQSKDKKLFTVEYLQYEITEKYKILSNEEKIKLLEKTNCDFLVNVTVKSEELKDDKQYVVKIDMGLKNNKYIKPIENTFKKEFFFLGNITRRVEFLKKDKIQVLEVTANRLSFICQYIIARVTYFNRNFEMAQIIFEELYSNIKKLNEDELIVKILKNIIPKICWEIHLRFAEMYNEKFNKNRDYKELEKMNSELEIANSYIYDTYEFHLCKSVYMFLKYRDIKLVKDELKKCKEKRLKGTWEYNDAFISAYEGNSELTVFNKYKKALKNEYNLIYLMDFIENILQEEERNMLRFALVILNLEVGNVLVAKELLMEYLEKKELDCLDEKVKEILTRKYKDLL